MHDAETRALGRAAVLLLVVCLARLGWSRASGGAPPTTESVLPQLTESVREATAEGARRAAPLAEGELIDPNRASAADLDRLPGIGPSTADAIVAARQGGVVFRRPDDLASVRGIGPVLVARIGPLLDLRDPPPGGPRGSALARRPFADPHAARPGPERVDLARAGAAELEGLPGVGPALAERILARRRARPFTSVDDLLDVRGIGPATLERLRPMVTLGGRR